jgi:hypothetical protein
MRNTAGDGDARIQRGVLRRRILGCSAGVRRRQRGSPRPFSGRDSRHRSSVRDVVRDRGQPDGCVAPSTEDLSRSVGARTSADRTAARLQREHVERTAGRGRPQGDVRRRAAHTETGQRRRTRPAQVCGRYEPVLHAREGPRADAVVGLVLGADVGDVQQQQPSRAAARRTTRGPCRLVHVPQRCSASAAPQAAARRDRAGRTGRFADSAGRRTRVAGSAGDGGDPRGTRQGGSAARSLIESSAGNGGRSSGQRRHPSMGRSPAEGAGTRFAQTAAGCFGVGFSSSIPPGSLPPMSSRNGG